MIGALLGFISIAFGAYAEHGLRETISEENFRYLMTAIRYNQVHAVMICAIGLYFLADTKASNMLVTKISSLLFIVGTVLFSFSIYFSVTLDIPALLNITPIGGLSIMAAWLFLAITGYAGWRKI